jgi:hypothetical protein
MKLITTTAISLIAALSAAPAAAQGYGPAPAPTVPQPPAQPAAAAPAAPAAAQPKVMVSKKALKAIQELQKAVTGNDVANIPAKLAAAQAVATTKDDRYAIGILQRQAAIAAKDNVALAAAVDALANSGFLEPAKVSALYMDLGVKEYNAQHYPQAVAAFQKGVTLAPNDAQNQELLAQGLVKAGQNAVGVAAFQRAFQARSAAGEKAAEDLYRVAIRAAFDARLPAALNLARQWITNYPSAESWTQSILVYRGLSQPGVGPTLDLLRLMRAAGALSRPADYQLYATAAADQGNFAEAQAVIDQGIAAKVVDPNSDLFRDIVSGLKTKPKATAADLAAAAKNAPTGRSLIGIGDRYYGIGEYSKAVDTYRLAITKGADASLANLHIGMALARAGDKAGATAALNSVSGPLADIAKFWLIYVQHQA